MANSKVNEVCKTLIGPAVFILFVSIPIGGIEYVARGAIGLLLWMLLWWIMQPVSPTVTALLPIFAAQIFNIAKTPNVLAQYFNATVVLLLSANIMTLAWTKWGFDRRLSMMIMMKVGNNPRKLVTMWFILSVTLSSMIANAVVAAVLFPIVMTTIKAVNIEEAKIKDSNYATAALLAVAWGSNVGFGTPLGGAMNLVAIKYIEEMVIMREFMYIDWIVRCIPLVFFVAAPMLLLLLTTKFEYKDLPGTKEVLQAELSKLGKMNRGEITSLVLFLSAFILSLARPLFQEALPTLTANYIFLIAALLTFVLPGSKSERLLTWDFAQPKIKWGVFFLIAGGTALGDIMNSSGVGQIVADALSPIAGIHPFIAVVVFSLMACFFSNIMTITGSMALVQPIVITTMYSLGMNPVPFVFLSNAAGNISICLPSSGAGPAMVGGYGVDLKKMTKMGIKTVPFCLLSVILLGYLMYLLWPGFGTLS